MNPLFLADFYKFGHVNQYPADTEQVWSNWTARSSRVPGQHHIIHFGLQYLIKKYLQAYFDQNFFSRPRGVILKEYRDLVRATLGIENPRTDHIERLYEYGFLPITIWSLPEGSSVPLNCPALVITNTMPEMFWLPNYLETLLSNILWMPSTSATTAQRYRQIFQKYAAQAGETDFAFIDWQGHDFSYRGMAGLESAVLSGLGHLTSFSGTDTVPAIVAAQDYYGAELTVGGSVPATEHSVMCAGTKDSELDTFRRLLTEVYPSGIVSVVSDTWDLWKVLTEYVPELKPEILNRPDGKLVIRPDSGDPVNIICGDPDSHSAAPHKGTLRLLAEALGTSVAPGAKLPLINKAGAIYGDSITTERADAILYRCVHELKLSPYNCIFGIGSFTYQHVTRDTFNFAMKATAVRRSGKIIPIFKSPVTDDGGKKSHLGIPAVYRNEMSTEDSPRFFVEQECTPEMLENCAFERVFHNGVLEVVHGFDAIRKRVRA